ncbi:hypothetical protein QBC37DRAFT_82367 [Rhypophila decipiens]|uniref:Impact N-terminal domain-containing protein n=1 Tax=Rhypophila decipiens TaxID=261697 RepID=A0AAN6XWW2_9PEZI|nr:hypothetical protein QBC37DRAFT_82367 [Rhypophila decipiens]
MASQQDLQELLRLLTVARKVPMMQAMAQIKSLQAVELRSIRQISEAPLATVQTAINDEKAAKALHSACKAAVKRGDLGNSTTSGTKRPASTSDNTAASSKRPKQDFTSGPVEMTPQELESSLELPVNTDQELISQTAIETNRAPLVLAFAVELLRHTMPEQPLSSRLSLSQAVVSANSRTKAVSIGLEKGPSAEQEGFGEGQPRVRVMGREIAVLKRSGYEWRGDETVGSQVKATQSDKTQQTETQSSASTSTLTASYYTPTQTQTQIWSTSSPITLRSSTFVARATAISSPSERKFLLQSLLASQPNLKSATHNAWAYRLRPPEGSRASAWGSLMIREESFDDGETGAGDLLLKIMRELNTVNTLVVMSRWYGGIMLGPDRWRLMRNVVTDALGQRLRKAGGEVQLGGEAVWGLDLEAVRNKSSGSGTGSKYGGITSVVGTSIHSPQGARTYLLKSFATPSPPTKGTEGKETTHTKKRKQTLKEIDAEKEDNLGLLLGALRIVFDSWADHLDPAELDRRAWAWYVAVRPDVEHGPGGWGAKGVLRLQSILDLKRREGGT